MKYSSIVEDIYPRGKVTGSPAVVAGCCSSLATASSASRAIYFRPLGPLIKTRCQIRPLAAGEILVGVGLRSWFHPSVLHMHAAKGSGEK